MAYARVATADIVGVPLVTDGGTVTTQPAIIPIPPPPPVLLQPPASPAPVVPSAPVSPTPGTPLVAVPVTDTAGLPAVAATLVSPPAAAPAPDTGWVLAAVGFAVVLSVLGTKRGRRR